MDSRTVIKSPICSDVRLTDTEVPQYRKLSTVKRELEWLAKQFSKEHESYWEKDTVS